MAFQPPLTIKQIIDSINFKHFLPAIQREYVWDEIQIANLFDSLMQGYPIGSLLFWRVGGDNLKSFEFYSFLQDYHERDLFHNQKVNLSGKFEIEAVLDGQQRLTSLFLGLKGTYTTKKPYLKHNDPNAYPKRKLFINLKNTGREHETDNFYDIQFFETPPVPDESNSWFKIGDILDLDFSGLNSFIQEKNLTKEEQNTLSKLFETIHIKPIMNYYLVQSADLHTVLNIFVRVNSGGTKLSYSDLLLSIASASWEERDAREELLQFVDQINLMGFEINKDFVLKTSLLMLNKDIKFKVDNFNKPTMLAIESNWIKLKEKILIAYSLLKRWGYSSVTLNSNYPAAILAYHLYKFDISENKVIFSSEFHKVRNNFKKFVAKALIKQVFSGSLDSILVSIRRGIVEDFDLRNLNEELPLNKKLTFSDEDLNSLMEVNYSGKLCFSILSCIYPNFDFSREFHIDHFFPISTFQPSKFPNAISESELSILRKKANLIPNLQFLEAIPNISKNDTEPEEWLRYNFENDQTKISEFKLRNHINPDIDLSFSNFLDFFEARKEKMKEVLRISLN